MRFKSYLSDINEARSQKVTGDMWNNSLVILNNKNAKDKVFTDAFMKAIEPYVIMFNYKGNTDGEINPDGAKEKSSVVIKDATGKYFKVVSGGRDVPYFQNAADFKGNGAPVRTREFLYMAMFEYFVEKKKILSEDQLIRVIEKSKDPNVQRQLYRSSYYTGALRQIEVLKGIKFKSDSYLFEIDNGEYSQAIYDIVRGVENYNGSSNHWNPADIWLFTKKGAANVKQLSVIPSIQSIGQVNAFIAKNIISKDIIPISLKHSEASVILELLGMPDSKEGYPEVIPPLKINTGSTSGGNFSITLDYSGYPADYRKYLLYSDTDARLGLARVDATLRGTTVATKFKTEFVKKYGGKYINHKDKPTNVTKEEWKVAVDEVYNSECAKFMTKPKSYWVYEDRNDSQLGNWMFNFDWMMIMIKKWDEFILFTFTNALGKGKSSKGPHYIIS